MQALQFENMVSYAQARDCDKMVESIYESGKRAADIVKDMLSFSRQSEKALVSNKVTDLMTGQSSWSAMIMI